MSSEPVWLYQGKAEMKVALPEPWLWKCVCLYVHLCVWLCYGMACVGVCVLIMKVQW